MNETAVRLLMAPGVDLPDLADFAAPRPSWQARGACAGGEKVHLFFIERGGDSRPAKALCDGCSVLNACHDYAMADPGLRGFWAGTSERDRQRSRAVDQAA